MKKLIGKCILSIGALFIVISYLSQDVLPKTHIFNAMWPPHARFHGVISIVVSIGIGLVVLWLIWRRSDHYQYNLTLASVLLAIVLVSFPIAGMVVGVEGSAPPGTPTILGTKPPVLITTVLLLLTPIGYFLAKNKK